MKARVFTLCWGTAYDRYGQTFIETFDKFWPKNVDLMVVSDRDIPMPRGTVSPMAEVVGLVDFKKRWGKNPKAQGMVPPAGAKRDPRGYAWRFDALKWMPQAMAPLAALQGMSDGDILCWFDADVETTGKVKAGWLAELLGDADMACLQRTNYHSEIGCYVVRVNPKTREMLIKFAELYAGDGVFKLAQWHSAFAFDHAAASVDGLKIRNLNPAGGKGHVWPATALAKYTVHNKGKRKDK